MKSSKLLLAVAVTGILALAPAGLHAQGDQSPATQNTGQKQWKDRAEYDLFDAINKDTNPQTRLEKLNQWKEKYPTTDFSELRQRTLLTTYAAAGKVQEALNAANEILAKDPSDFYGLYYTAYETPLLASMNVKPTEDQLSAAEKAANAIIGGAKPGDVSDTDWQQAKNAAQAIAHRTLGWVALQRKQYDKAETEFKTALGINSNDSEVSYWLGLSILGEQKPERYSEALYNYAHAAAYDGQGALAPAGRATVKGQLQTYYTKYHGSADGLDQLLQQAKTSPTPPADFKIPSIADIENAKIEKEKQETAANPALALWKNIKAELTGANGATYFEGSMKATLMPELTGKVISMEPAVRPKIVVIGIENGTTPDATLKFETPLPGKVEPGTTLKFQGSPESYAANPFMVTFVVDKKNLQGWTGTNPTTTRPPVHRKPAAHAAH